MDLDELTQYGSMTAILLSIIVIFVSGLFFGFVHFTLDSTETAFQSTDCVIQNNSLVSSCQDLFDLALYPFLGLRDVLIWFSFLFIFALVIAMLVLGYKSGKSPVLMGVLVLFVMTLTYLGIEISNVYRGLLENEVFRTVMTDFTVYSQIMLNFPWFIFIVSLSAAMLSIVNWQRTRVNTASGELDY